MLLRSLFVILAALVVTPAIANEYYIAQKTVKRCKVVDVKPDGTTWMLVGTSTYHTLDEARAALKGAPECAMNNEKHAQ